MSTKKYTINSELTVLPGVGPSLISIFNKLGIYTVFDLLFYFPRDYKDYRKTTDLESIVENENITIKGKIIKSNLLRSRKRIYEVLLDDGTSKFKVIWFNPIYKYLKENFEENKWVVLSGKAYKSNSCLIDTLIDLYPVPIGVVRGPLIETLYFFIAFTAYFEGISCSLASALKA